MIVVGLRVGFSIGALSRNSRMILKIGLNELARVPPWTLKSTSGILYLVNFVVEAYAGDSSSRSSLRGLQQDH